MRKYVLNLKTMHLGYIEDGKFFPLAMYLSRVDCGTAMEIINLDEYL